MMNRILAIAIIVISEINGSNAQMAVAKTTAIVARINKKPVSKEELQWRMKFLRSECYSYFFQKYGVYNEPDFLQHSFNGEVPLKWMKKEALKRIVRDKAIWQIASGYGLKTDLDFTAFKKKYEQENQRRKESINEKKVIYGLSQFDEMSFYNYMMSNLINDLIRKMEEKNKAGEQDLKAYYEKEKDQYKIQPTINAEFLYLKKDSLNTDMLREWIKENQSGSNSKIVIPDFLNSKTEWIDSVIFSPQSAKTDEFKWHELYIEVLSMRESTRLKFLEDLNGNSVLLLIRNVIDNGFAQFESVKDLLQKKIAEEKFNMLLQQKIDRAVVWVLPAWLAR